MENLSQGHTWCSPSIRSKPGSSFHRVESEAGAQRAEPLLPCWHLHYGWALLCIQQLLATWMPEILRGKVSEFLLEGNSHHKGLDSLNSFIKWKNMVWGKGQEILEAAWHKLNQFSYVITNQLPHMTKMYVWDLVQNLIRL